MQLKSSTIIITGASDGIGEDTSYEFAKEKSVLILLGRNKEKLSKVAKKAQSLGAKKVETYSVDLRNVNEIKNFSLEIKNKYQKIDGLINNAGIWQKKNDLELIPEEELFSVININLTGLILLTRELLPLLKKSGDSFIINVSSRSGYFAQQGQSVYSASKYGVRGFTEVLREDLKETSVRVAGVYQGGTNTQMFNKAGEGFSAEKLATFIPADELAKTFVFLVTRPKGIWLPELKVENK